MAFYELPGDEQEHIVARCPACGGTAFHWGRVTSHVPLWLKSETGQKRLFAAEPETRARVCARCGNLQFFIIPE